MLVIETNIDDMNPQHFDHVMERLFAAGARDVFLAPIQMKKNRPATLLTVICELAQRDRLARLFCRRPRPSACAIIRSAVILLAREAKKVKTRFGEVTVKIVTQPDGSQRATPEYDDLKRIAAANSIIAQNHSRRSDEASQVANTASVRIPHLHRIAEAERGAILES